MYTGPFHQFHDARYKYLLTITDPVNLYFFSPDIVIYQYWFFLVDLYRCFQILA